MNKIIVTSALPYVNNIPHLGTLVCIIGADCYARYLKICGKNVLSVLGTDEHGTTAETTAIAMGISPRELVDRYFREHTRIYEWFGCNFDCYGRTSSDANHKTSIEIFEGLKANGYILEQEQEQLYCTVCSRFLADRFVEGICPHCGYMDARGDQCDSCGKLINPTELCSPRCKICHNKPEKRSTKHIFIDLPKMAPVLSNWIDSCKAGWSQNARNMTEAWLKEGLRPRAISRDLNWGISIPGYPGKVFYSWFDAPIGYISITRENRKDWQDWWKSDDTELVQFMGKDNIPFHTILFPAFLIGSGMGYTLVKRLSVNEYLNYEGGKFSKSRNIGVFGDDAIESGIPADAFRYYLMVNRPERSDTEFIWTDFQEKINNELVANLGNLVNRTLVFVSRFYENKVPNGKLDDELMKLVYPRIEAVRMLMDQIEIKEALRSIMAISKIGNQYFQSRQPWKAIKAEPADAAKAIFSLVDLIKRLSILIMPFMPKTSADIMRQLNWDKNRWDDMESVIDAGHKIGQPVPLFAKLDDYRLAELQRRYSGRRGIEPKEVKINEFPLDLRVGVILSVDSHPKAEKLYVLQVNIGEKEIQLVAGLKPYYSATELIGRHIIVVTNLKPAVIRGMVSQGMMLAGDDGKDVKALFMPNSSPGMQVKPIGFQVKSIEIDIHTLLKLELAVKGKRATYDGKILCSDSEEALVDLKDGARIR